MKVRNVLLGILAIIGFIVLFFIVTAALAVGQTNPRTPVPPIATAQIPFDFWVGDTHLAAGEYALYPVFRLKNNTLVLLRNTKTNAQEQVFMVPTGERVASGDYKLVFVVRGGQHYLRELWESDGKAVLTSQYGISVGPTDTENEISLVGAKTNVFAIGVRQTR